MADVTADVFVLALDEDGVVEWGQLQMLKSHLQQRKALKMAMPKLIPDKIQISAALIDDTLPQIRGCQLNRFERMRGLDLPISHRWPKGACHIHPQFRSSSQVIFDLDILDLATRPNSLDRAHVSFQAQPGVISGVAYWLSLGDFAAPWIRCIQPLPARRLESPASCRLWANWSEIKIWFDWAEACGEAGCPVVPPLSKTKLPPWHFKMLNDHQRNRAYHLAIAKAIQRKAKEHEKLRVLDCGCGAGLLSLLALREGEKSLGSGAVEITAVELSPLISDITQEVFATSPQLKLITGDVRSLKVEQVGQFDLVVSELMDASGLGESLLSVLEQSCGNLARTDAQAKPKKTGSLWFSFFLWDLFFLVVFFFWIFLYEQTRTTRVLVLR